MDAGQDATTEMDATVEASNDATVEASVDASVDTGADSAQDAVTSAGCVQTACDALLATISVSAAGTTYHAQNTKCGATELAVYQKVPSGGTAGACLACGLSNGLLDLAPSGSFSNVECEDLGNIGDGGTAAGMQECMDTLLCDLGLTANGTDSCGTTLYSSTASPIGTLLSNAFCGAGIPPSTCTSGGAAGACDTQWRAGFEGQSDSNILSGDTVTTYPSGMANNLASQLLTNCQTACFP
ncbi:MAG TPA: hypothetical protein VFO27_03180 [Bryobacteraceae bacterium]|nr:hypothetical protein [Bryobacteraceae bacterium]